MNLQFLNGRYVDGTGASPALSGTGCPDIADLGLEDAPSGRPFHADDAESRLFALRGQGFGGIRAGICQNRIEADGNAPWNEAYLAWLRKLLLAAEKAGVAVCLVFIPSEDPAFPERFLAACRHACRRLKNCRAVAACGVVPLRKDPDTALFTAFRERLGEVFPTALFFMETRPENP